MALRKMVDDSRWLNVFYYTKIRLVDYIGTYKKSFLWFKSSSILYPPI